MKADATSSKAAQFGVFVVDLETGELRKHGAHVKLQDQPFRVLAMLLEHPGELVTREEIKQRLWPTDTFVDFDHGMNTAIRRLRDALGDSADNPLYIETLPRKGYRFIAPVTEVEPPPSPQLSLPLSSTIASAKVAKLSAWTWIGLLSFLAIVAVVGWLLWPRNKIDSVAVLPFVAPTNDASLEVLGDGISRRVLDGLSSFEGLRVISNTSVAKYKGNEKPTDVAASLKVRGVVLGNIRRDRDSVEVQIEMVDTKEDRHIVGKTYRVKESQIAELEGNILLDIADRLKLSISPQLREQLSRSKTNSDAYQAFLRGDGIMNRRDNANFRSALIYFQHAVDADPKFALGYIGIGKAYGLLGAYGGMPMTEAGPIGEANFDRALELDPNSAEAHAYKAVSLMTIHRNLAASEKELKRSLELNPNNPFTCHSLTELYVRQHRLEEALASETKAEGLDPYWPGFTTLRFWILYYLHRNDEALQIGLAHDFVKNNHLVMAELYANAGRKSEAAAEFAKTDPGKMQTPEAICLYARVSGKLGEPDIGKKALERALQLQEKLGTMASRACTPYGQALAYAALKDREKMYAALDETAATLEPRFGYISAEPLFDPYRSEPRFKELLKLATTPR